MPLGGESLVGDVRVLSGTETKSSWSEDTWLGVLGDDGDMMEAV
jgi:hypothetical protein